MTNNGWMDGWMDGGGDGANGTQLPLHNAWPQLTYPLRCDTQHKQLPQQLRVSRIHSSVLHRSLGRNEMQTN
jgi:hypothetical protein